jgi:hypothetical protein
MATDGRRSAEIVDIRRAAPLGSKHQHEGDEANEDHEEEF